MQAWALISSTLKSRMGAWLDGAAVKASDKAKEHHKEEIPLRRIACESIFFFFNLVTKALLWNFFYLFSRRRMFYSSSFIENFDALLKTPHAENFIDESCQCYCIAISGGFKIRSFLQICLYIKITLKMFFKYLSLIISLTMLDTSNKWEIVGKLLRFEKN